MCRCGDVREQADYAYALREVYRMLDDLRKEVNTSLQTAEKMCCILWTQSSGESIRTAHCTATPKVRMIASLPRRSKDPEAFAELMTFLGINEELWDREEEVVRPHFPGFREYLSSRLEQGLSLPPGIDPNRVYPEYSLLIQAKKGVDEA